MKKQTKVRIMAVLLAMLMLIPAMIACTPETPGPNTPGNNGTTPGGDVTYPDSLPAIDMGGIELTFAYLEQGTVKEGCSIKAGERDENDDDKDGDVIEPLMYDRNRYVEERFDVYLRGSEVPTVDGTGITPSASPILLSGSPEYDVLVGYQYYDVALAAQGYLYNINNMENSYINIENPWWSTDYIRNINYGDKLYWLTGDVTLMHIATMMAAYVHSVPYTNYLEEDYGNIYDIVRDMDWTLATLAEMSEVVYFDLNSNEVEDKGDRFGFQNTYGIETAFCAGINSSSRNEDGSFTVAIDSKRTSDIMWYLDQLANSPKTFKTDDIQERFRTFASGDVMCFFGTLLDAENPIIRNIEEDFYILPLPMGDDLCEDYRTTCTTGTNIVGISYCSAYPEESAAVLEALAAQSSVSVTPVYYDTVLKDRYTRDDDSKEMIDMIREKVAVDFANTWSLGYTETYIFYMDFDSGTVASRVKTYAPQWQEVLDDLQDVLNNLS